MFLAASVSIYKNLLMLSWKYETVPMTPRKIAKSLYWATLYLRLSAVGGQTQYLALV
jgi:hypothetical protein